MDPKEVKQLLKEAKEGLKKNDHMGAAKACKTIIKKEPENYQAHLLLGTAFREQAKWQQALEAYKKAVKIDANQVYAWQGIISIYEKQNIKTHTDLLDAYKRVATHFEKDDKQKYIDNTVKLANILISQQDSAKALKVIARLAKSVGINLELAQLLVQLLNSTTSATRTPEEDTLYTNALEVLLAESTQPADGTYKTFFSQLYRNNLYEKLTEKCIETQPKWNHYSSPMEWLCRLYLESHVDSSLIKSNCGGIEKMTDRLFKLHPSSRYGYFARGKFLIEESFKYIEGFSWLNNALESSYHLHAALVLVRGKLKFGDYEGGLEEAAKAIANCSGDKAGEKAGLRTQFELLQLEGLIGTNDTERAEQERLKLQETFKDASDHPQLVHFLDLSAQTALKNKDLSELSILVSSIEEGVSLNGLPVWRLDFYKSISEAVKAGEKFGSYIQSVILTHPNIPELLLAAGIFLYDHEDFETTAEILTTLAETDEGRNHPHTWKYLGLIAKLDGEPEKAAKYLKRSYDLNMESDVGALLSDMYHEMGELELKKSLLLDATEKVRKTKSKWVWARLGLLYLEEGNYLGAVESLQCAIRVDLEDGYLWESLADAYFYRGSLQAALRCYNKAVENGVDPIYPKMRISSIYQSLEEEDKSIAGLKELIQENPSNFPLQLELAEVYCWVAKEKVRENFDIGAVTAVENGLVSVVKAILHPDAPMAMTLPWLIIGDYSITLCDLAETTQLDVPGFLINPQENSSVEDNLKVMSLNLNQFKEIGTKALIQSLQILEASALDTSKIQEEQPELLGYLYHQIALSYYNRSRSTKEEEPRKKFLHLAIQYGKKALAKCQNNSLYWNTIGLVAFHLSDIPFSQHCFISALKIDVNNVVAWSNLGMLYFQQGEFIRAHRSFAKGQCVAPIYANSWIGQGICAEMLKPAEAPDLFRHACLLRHHPFAITSYGNAICKFLLEKDSKDKEESSEEQRYWKHHLLVRMDAVTHLYDLIGRVERREATPQLYNLKGIVSGWNGFYQTSLDSFETAQKLGSVSSTLTDDETRAIHSNKVSSLISLKMFAEAKEELSTLPRLDEVGLGNAALALYKLGEIPSAIDMYQRILASPQSEDKKAEAKIVLSLLMNDLHGGDAAKSILFAKDMMKNPRALLTLGAIGAGQSDNKLLGAVLAVLVSYQWSSHLAPDICFLMACHELLNGSPQSAVKVVLRFIHMYPTTPRLYALACQLIIVYCLQNYNMSIPRHLALCTLKIARIMGSSREDGLFASRHSGMASLTHLIECDHQTAVRATLKAIRCYPEQRDNWAVLICAYWVQYHKSESLKLFTNIVNILEREINLGLCSGRVTQWMSAFRMEIAKQKYGTTAAV